MSLWGRSGNGVVCLGMLLDYKPQSMCRFYSVGIPVIGPGAGQVKGGRAQINQEGGADVTTTSHNVESLAVRAGGNSGPVNDDNSRDIEGGASLRRLLWALWALPEHRRIEQPSDLDRDYRIEPHTQRGVEAVRRVSRIRWSRYSDKARVLRQCLTGSDGQLSWTTGRAMRLVANKTSGSGQFDRYGKGAGNSTTQPNDADRHEPVKDGYTAIDGSGWFPYSGTVGLPLASIAPPTPQCHTAWAARWGGVQFTRRI